jgi:mono/diheme cytochrome c family protein
MNARLPVGVKAAGLVLVTTAFYTYVGQLVPQKEVPAPEVIEISKDMTTVELVEVGRDIAGGKGLCLTCHTVGQSGALRFPDLAGIATRAGQRVPGLSALDYMAQSMYEPDAFIVEGFNPGMPAIHKPPIALTDQEIRAVLAWLQTLGGTATITTDTEIPYLSATKPAAEPAGRASGG